tara:strand:+ start:421 stop:1248 length:828 start_codon:yes stop_codon:yes gene_type:complete
MQDEINNLLNIIYESGQIVKTHFYKQEKSIKIKEDKTKVTNADIEINKFLIKKIKKDYSNYSYLSEESNYDKQLSSIKNENFFIIDPIDGTRSFIKGSKEFTINLSIIKDKKIYFSVIYSPIFDILYYAHDMFLYKINSYSDFKISNFEKISTVNYNIKCPINLVMTRNSLEIDKIKKFIENSNLKFNFFYESSSLKFCNLSINKYNLHIRKANTKLWDVAAGFHIVNNAGYVIEDLYGNEIFTKLFYKDSLEKISENNFEIEEFIVRPKNLEIF